MQNHTSGSLAWQDAMPTARVPPELTRTMAYRPEVSTITDWLVEQGLARVGFERIVAGFCERLVAIDVPLWRGYVSARTLHPRFSAAGYIWRPGHGVLAEAYPHWSTAPPQGYADSPFRRMDEQGLRRLRVVLHRDGPAGFPLLERFRSEGATDYYAQMVGFGIDGEWDGRSGVMLSWTSDRAAGFGEREIEVLDHLLPRLALALQARLGHEITVNLLDAYVGPEAGRRILAGEIKRGSLQAISAVVFYADLRGFTSMAEQVERQAIIEALNAYFDCLVPIVATFRGEVLKFLGDGLLATFSLEGEDAAAVCARALDAAAEALRCLRALNAERAAAGLPAMALDIALHLGEVFYGNVGSADRLDFTVIGPAVNEASRIEALCGQHDRSLLISETFARAATRSGDRLVSIGRFALRGVGAAQSIYTLDGI